MAIEVEQERRFYDEQYARHLGARIEDLRVDRRMLERWLADPRETIYERRLLYRTALEKLLAEPLAGINALDYGCGTGEWGVLLATEGAAVALLDLSPVAIEIGLRRARGSDVAERVAGYARDAADLSCFEDGEFDLVFASAAIHHTLKYPNAFEEFLRVIKPGGRIVLAEGWGNNRLLNAARRLRWKISREPEEAGEGIIFEQRDVDTLRRHLVDVEVVPLNLLAMTKRLFRGRFESRFVRGVMSALEGADRILLGMAPRLGRFCGEAVITARKPAAAPQTSSTT